MTNSVNRITAVEKHTDSETNFIAQNTDDNYASTPVKASNNTASYNDDASYSVVYVDEAPSGYDEMKELLNKCISSYHDMADYAQSLKAKNENLFVQVNAKSAEVANLTLQDGTGSCAQSAYCLTFQDDQGADESNTDSAKTEQLNKKEVTKQANKQEVQNKIDTKQSEIESLNTNASQNSDELSGLNQDMNINQSTINKVMEKIGEDTSHINGMMRYANAGAVAGGAAGLDPVSSAAASFFGFSSIFGGGKAKKRAEIKQLGTEAYRAQKEVSRVVQQCSNKLVVAKSISDGASNRLKEKQLQIDSK